MIHTFIRSPKLRPFSCFCNRGRCRIAISASGFPATHPRHFRQTAARAPALEGSERLIFDKDGAPMADIRVRTPRPSMWRTERPYRCGSLAKTNDQRQMERLGWRGRAPRGLHGPCRPQDGCERSARSGALPSLHPNKHPTRNSQRVATLILRPSMAHWHALRGNSDARRGQACPPAASGAHCASPRISG